LSRPTVLDLHREKPSEQRIRRAYIMVGDTGLEPVTPGL
jgi:hypothetical protein